MSRAATNVEGMLRRIFPSAALTASALLMLAPASAAFASTDVSFVANGPGYSNMYDGQSAGSYNFTVEGVVVEAFCGDLDRAFDSNAAYGTTPSSLSGIPGAGTAGWVAANHMSVGTPYPDDGVEAAAVQVAIWTFTNGIEINETTVPDVDVRVRALELEAAGQGKTLSSDPANYVLSVTADADNDSATFTAVLTADDNPAVDHDVTFDVDGVTTVVETTADGIAVLDIPAAALSEVSVIVTYSGVIAAGTAIMSTDATDQPLIMSASVPFTRSAIAAVTLPAQAPTTTAPTPTTVVTPPAEVIPTAAAFTPSELPATGETGSTGRILVAGVALLALAGASGLLARRKTA